MSLPQDKSAGMFGLRILLLLFLLPIYHAIIHDCNHFLNSVYTIRYCALTNISVTHDAEEVVFRSEYPRPYNFEFYDSRLTEIPRIMFTSFPEMQNLDVSRSQIENINKYTFEHAKELRYLNLSSNQLTVLNDFVFKGCDKLMRLDISNNRIVEVKEKALYDATKIDHLDLSKNELHDLDRDLFSKLNLLTYLSLANNKLSMLHDNLFDNCSMIAYLDLKGNRIHSLSDSFLRSLIYLRTLVIDNNSLTTLKIPPQLTKLFAAENNLTSVYTEDSSKSQLYLLMLSGNNLADIKNITTLESIVILDLSFNPIGPLNLTTFLRLKKLTDLNLEATKLGTLEHGIFAQQSKLRRLDISYNALRVIDITVLTSTPSLEKLFVDGNEIRAINYEHIPELFPNLTYLGLFANAWNCSYLTTLVRNCNRRGISVSPTKAYGEVSHLTNVQGIYCASSDKERILFQPVYHDDDNLDREKDVRLKLMAEKLSATGFDQDSVVELLEMIRLVNTTSNSQLEEVRRIALHTDRNCEVPFASGYQVFIMLILTTILVLNVAFLLYVHYNANARRAIDRMIIFRRGETASVQTHLEDF
ncbi:leucine-rich repeat-containing G-protein coupled receptor 4-like [Toxorhynchites rutilus septentrionalis]|uniref:leucine-rich repeat-containing G-protein coupled receptor 4-like n=1 Tax=Toxorhynchites rutilus septentrionalis TaxID=329112 RepID=UPI002478FF80|nr:leucine-rich repeat-containing G-protein coupled receptor 4-like [Toxorhynchites rutilus septentrionalis]